MFTIPGILLSGVLAGVETVDEGLPAALLTAVNVAEVAILLVFTGECVLKLLAEGRHPLMWRYFRRAANLFDLVIVVICAVRPWAGLFSCLSLYSLCQYF